MHTLVFKTEEGKNIYIVTHLFNMGIIIIFKKLLFNDECNVGI